MSAAVDAEAGAATVIAGEGLSDSVIRVWRDYTGVRMAGEC